MSPCDCVGSMGLEFGLGVVEVVGHERGRLLRGENGGGML